MPIMSRTPKMIRLIAGACFITAASLALAQSSPQPSGKAGTVKAAPTSTKAAPAAPATPIQAQPTQPDNVRRGLYIATAGGCVGCHTAEGKEASPYAGGRALKTPFGTFYGPNITPHPEAGIGRWTEADLLRALRRGERPDGAHYFPAFPYPSFTRISDTDIKDLWAYLRSLPPNPQANKPHELNFPFGWRFLVTGWKLLFFTPGNGTSEVKAGDVIGRGAYLAGALGHCGECHTPRNFLGGPNHARLLGGTKNGPEGKSVPNITPARMKKIGDGDLKEYLLTGLTPDGDVANETMAEVIRNTTSKLTPEDLAALIAYLRSVPAVEPEK